MVNTDSMVGLESQDLDLDDIFNDIEPRLYKQCSKCKETKHVNEFYPDACKASKLCSYCKVCSKAKTKQYNKDNIEYVREAAKIKSREYRKKNREKCNATARNWYKNNSIKGIKSSLNYKYKQYGTSYDEMQKLKETIGHRCQICKEKTDLAVDHCHTTNKFRGLLCKPCNSAIGLLKEDPAILESAINYINKWNLTQK